MIKAFKQIPEPLQKQILYRLAYGAAILFVTIVLFFYTLDWLSVLACVIAIIACIISAFSLFRRAVIVDYVEVRGEFLKVILNTVKRRPKAIILRTEDNQKLKVMIKQKIKKSTPVQKLRFMLRKMYRYMKITVCSCCIHIWLLIYKKEKRRMNDQSFFSKQSLG